MSRATAEAPLFDFAEQNARVSECGYHQPGPRLRGPARWRLLTVSVVFAVAILGPCHVCILSKPTERRPPKTTAQGEPAERPIGGGSEVRFFTSGRDVVS